MEGGSDVLLGQSPGSLCSRGSSFPSSTPGYGENGHEPDVMGKARSRLILKNPVSDAAGEEGNRHFPWREGDRSVTPVTISSCPSPCTIQKAGAEPADPSLFSDIKLFKD